MNDDLTSIDQRLQFMDEMSALRIHASQVHRSASKLKDPEMPDLEEAAAAAVGADELADAIYDLEHACSDGNTLVDTQLEEWRNDLTIWGSANVG